MFLGISGDHSQPVDVSKSRDDLIDHSVRKIVLSGITSQIGKRQYDDGRSFTLR